jgi:hypothetical protein
MMSAPMPHFLHCHFLVCRYALAVVCALVMEPAFAQGFAALVSPPRFELSATPGERIRQVVEISNDSNQATNFKIRTADWSLDANGAVTFYDELQPKSCRPWVAIERRELAIPAAGRYRYRFEVAPPPDAEPRECRFALLIEGDDQNVLSSGGVSFPVAGRIGVVVYVAVGKVAPVLEIVGARVGDVNGVATPIVLVRNTGTAHGRLAGFLSGTDAAGRNIEFSPATLPILAGETRAISLGPASERDAQGRIAFPITIRGNLEWGDKNVPFEQRFAP